MKRTLITTLIALLAALAATAGPIGSWTLHKAYRNATAATVAGQTVYALYDGNLLAYDTATEEVRLLSKTTGLSDRHISIMARSESARCLVLAYDNGNIDLLFDDGNVVNLPQFRLDATADHTPADITVDGHNAVLATASGVAVLDLDSRTIRNAYQLGERACSAAIFDGYLYVALAGRLRRGNLTANLLDAAAWEDYAPVQAQHLVPCAGRLFFTASGAHHGFWRIDPDAAGQGAHPYTRIWLSLYTTVWTDGRQAVFSNPRRWPSTRPSAPTAPPSRSSMRMPGKDWHGAPTAPSGPATAKTDCGPTNSPPASSPPRGRPSAATARAATWPTAFTSKATACSWPAAVSTTPASSIPAH